MDGTYLAEALRYLVHLDRRQLWPPGCRVGTVLTAHALDYGQLHYGLAGMGWRWNLDIMRPTMALDHIP